MRPKSVAIVTGASQGIGRATALRLARDFSAVVLAARNKQELQETDAASPFLRSGPRRTASTSKRP
jgi:3-oxoacyl-[acyl-carrier protein] reductase